MFIHPNRKREAISRRLQMLQMAENNVTEQKSEVRFKGVRRMEPLYLKINQSPKNITVECYRELHDWEKEVITYAIREGTLANGLYHYTGHAGLLDRDVFWGGSDLIPPSGTSFVQKIQCGIFAKITSYQKNVFRQIMIFDKINREEKSFTGSPSPRSRSPLRRPTTECVRYFDLKK